MPEAAVPGRDLNQAGFWHGLTRNPLRLAVLGTALSLVLAVALAVVPVLLPPPGPGSAEVRFLQMMLPHHAQAAELVRRAEPGLRDAEVRHLAQDIARVQKSEMAQMTALLRAWGEAPQRGALDPAHASAMGMASPAQLARLSELAELARLTPGEGPSTETEKLFLALMVRHHQGALDMAGPLRAWWVRPQVRELAQHVGVIQRREVALMNRMLRERSASPAGETAPGTHHH